MSDYKPKFRCKIDKSGFKKSWLLGIGAGIFGKEKYIYISLFKITLLVGYLYDDDYFNDPFEDEFK